MSADFDHYTRYAKFYAEEMGIELQKEGETDRQFRERVAGVLRERGRLIEAHEIFVGARWDDPQNGDAVMRSVNGAMALLLAGVHFGGGTTMNPSDGVSQMGDDFCAGTIVEIEEKGR